jgi:DNA-binding beta-propeller fold protein YncE
MRFDEMKTPSNITVNDTHIYVTHRDCIFVIDKINSLLVAHWEYKTAKFFNPTLYKDYLYAIDSRNDCISLFQKSNGSQIKMNSLKRIVDLIAITVVGDKMYIADADDNCISRFDLTMPRQPIVEVMIHTNSLRSLRMITADKRYLYVVDAALQTASILVIDHHTNQIIETWPDDRKFAGLIAVDTKYVYVSNRLDHCVYVFDKHQNGKLVGTLTLSGSGYEDYRGIAIDESSVYVIVDSSIVVFHKL